MLRFGAGAQNAGDFIPFDGRGRSLAQARRYQLAPRVNQNLISCSLTPVHVRRDLLGVPVLHFGELGTVVDVYGHRLAFAEAKQRAGELAVVERG
jgi:hypothetical protein